MRRQFTKVDVAWIASLNRGVAVAPPVLDQHLLVGDSIDILNPVGSYDYSAANPAHTTASAKGCTNITVLELSFNEIASMDASGCSAMTQLSMSENLLTTVNIAGCPNLTDLYLDSNPGLTTIDISGSPLLLSLTFHLCAFTETAVNHVLTTLDANGLTGGYLQLYGASMAAPTGAGITSKNNLKNVKSWTVSTQ